MMGQSAETAGHVISYVGEFILGGIALFAVGIAYWAIRELKQTHRDHVETLKTASAQHVEMHKAYQTSSAEVVSSVTRLTDAENAQTTAIHGNVTALGETKSELRGIKDEMANLRRSVDNVIAEAVRRRRSYDRFPKLGDDKP